MGGMKNWDGVPLSELYSSRLQYLFSDFDGIPLRKMMKLK
jgi:hypothetical protein